MSTIRACLDRILLHCERLKRPVVAMLQEGLLPGELNEEASRFRVAIPGSIKELWCWRNGTLLSSGVILEDLYLVPGYNLMSLTESRQRYSTLCRNSLWDPRWIPFLCSGGGDFLAIECAETSATDGPIVHYFRGEEPEPRKHRSLELFLAFVEECFKRDAYYVTNDGHFEIDDGLQEEIYRNASQD